MNTKSALYVGEIEHRRFSPKKNFFSYSVCYYFLDLKEIPALFNIPLLFSLNRPGLLSFWRKDYLGSETQSIDQAVRDVILAKTQKICLGPIRMLANISYFGFCFNPVSFYYCYAEDGETLQFIVSEITNTPWGEKHQQVFSFAEKEISTFRFAKDFHVSPFMPMNIDYTWVFGKPDAGLHVFMQNRNMSEQMVNFDSTLKLERRELTAKNIFTYFLKFPFVTMKTMLAIYFQAAILFMKRVPFYSHPSKEKVYDNSSIT
ncbi:MAG: DUF1365 domain-containing protein [Bdellovibrionales bacterium]|nr:DUF1365 domain-containing protein [Bdellovibrionales bacterium]